MYGENSMTALKGKPLEIKISPNQVAFLEFLIWKSKNASDIAKQYVIWLLRQCLARKENVCISLNAEQQGELVGTGVHDMESGNGTTHITELFRLAGLPCVTSFHSGHFLKDEAPKGSGWYTIWISDRDYARDSTLLHPKPEEVQVIKPGPYPGHSY